MKVWLLLGLVILVAGCTQTGQVVNQEQSLCKGNAGCLYSKVTNVIDGDTIDIEDDRIRFAIVNAPERGEPGYQEAKDFVSNVCPAGSYATIDVDDVQIVDTTGTRTVGLVLCNGMNINEALLDNGLAGILPAFCGDASEFGYDDWAVRHGC